MKQKVAASFAIVLALVMMLSTNPAMLMPSSIFGSSDGDDGSQGESDSSESEQPEESEPEVPEEETETEPETEPELVDYPDGSQAATLAECPTPTATELVDCPDGSQAATLAECPAAAPALAANNILAPTTPQYNCIAEQVSSRYPTCGGGVENDPSYTCFEQVG